MSEFNPYDFRSSEKIPEEQIHIISDLYEDLARMVSADFSACLGTLVGVTLGALEQLSYSEFIDTIDSPTYMIVFTVNPALSRAILQINLNLAFSLIDRLLGGTGDVQIEKRGLTEIEYIVIERITRRILASIKDTWRSVLNLEPQIENKVSEPHSIQVFPPNEIMIIGRFQVRIHEITGQMNMGLPTTVFEPIIIKLGDQPRTSNKEPVKSNSGHAEIKQNLELARIPVVAHLGRTKITLTNLLRLHTGDIIRLDNNIKDRIEVLVKDKVKFYGKAGVVGKKKAVKIEHIIS